MKSMTKVLSMMCAGLLMASVFAGCGGEKKAGDTIKVGADIELTGGSASYGKSAQNAIKLAFDQVNAKGGVLGKKMELWWRIINLRLPKRQTQCRSWWHKTR